jgi:hypothetical protein
MKAQLKQIIELLDADERLALLDYLMAELPPSAVRETFERFETKLYEAPYIEHESVYGYHQK